MNRLALIVACMGIALSGCQGSGGSSGGNSGAPQPDPRPGPTPVPGPPTIISTLKPEERVQVKDCLHTRWRDYLAEGGPVESWHHVGPAYLIHCLTSVVHVTESDLTPQFQKDFHQIYRALNLGLGAPNI